MEDRIMATPKVPTQTLVDAMREETRNYLQSVMNAVNDAADGAWIAGSEEQVRDLSAKFRQQAFEKAVQLKIDAAEAAFPPSARSRDRQTAGE
jgi:hypothetical protein